jgi:hypothetical protein
MDSHRDNVCFDAGLPEQAYEWIDASLDACRVHRGHDEEVRGITDVLNSNAAE